jgi:cytochrome c553
MHWVSRLGAVGWVILIGASALAWGQTGARDQAARVAFFEKKIRPILANHCYNCHSANTNAKSGLRVDDRNGMIHGGNRGPAIVPGDSEKSLLIQAVRHTHAKVKMPPEKHLADSEVADLAQWIKDGAAWPAIELPASLGRYKEKYAKLRKEHWAFQPLAPAQVPGVQDTGWPRTDLDRFILASLERKGLKPVHDADRLALLRRVTFDVTGLPPTPAAVDAFLMDTSPDAFARVVDRLLASPAFGERWGRHWLDIARYGESTGPSRNIPYPHAWRYRDYVIDSFNGDKPYDQFIREQIAGDLLLASSDRQREDQLVATGFLALGGHDVNQRFKVRFIMDNVDEQIDTVSRAVLALTASCARCHDHKFDPIPTTDYYALAGIFCSTDLCAGIRSKMGGGGLDYYDTAMLLPLGPAAASDPDLPTKIAKATKALTQARKEFQALVDTPQGKAKGPDGRPNQMVARLKKDKLEQELSALTDPAVRGPVALGVREGKAIGDTEIRVRGEAEKLGPTVPRGFLSVIDVPDVPKIEPGRSGRLELAYWLTSPQNPLTARVIANRVWQHLFGQGLVPSVDNFGATGDAPSHSELLDFLARRFVAEGWSIKKLVRSIVLSRAYRLSADAPPSHVAVDPANRLVWRHSPRRLDAEEIRDAMLLVAGTLNLTRPHGSPAMELKVIEMPNNSPLAKKIDEAGIKSVHRSVYLPLVRGQTPLALAVFDFAEQGMPTGSRDSTTVPTQALYLLNDSFVRQQATMLASRLLAETSQHEPRQIDAVYRMTLGRSPTSAELARAQKYIRDYAADVHADARPRTAALASFCQALLASAEFRYLR